MIVTLIVVILTAIIWLIYYHYFRIKSSMSFKEANDLVGLPIITFNSTKAKLHFLLDTGADKSIFSKDHLDLIEHTLINAQGTLTDAGGHTIDVNIAHLKFYYEDKPFDGYFRLIDMTPVSNAIDLNVKGQKIDIVGVIGDDFLTKYKYVLDFSRMIAYSKK